MRLSVDSAACSGHGRCAAVAPDVYTLDEAGFNHMPESEVPPGLEAQARRGADNCPERAISVTD